MQNSYSLELCEERHKSINGCLSDQKDKLEKYETDIKDVQQAIVVLTQLQTRHDDEIRDHESRIRTMEQKPVKRYDNAIQQIITIFIAGALGGIISRLFS